MAPGFRWLLRFIFRAALLISPANQSVRSLFFMVSLFYTMHACIGYDGKGSFICSEEQLRKINDTS